MGIKKPSLKGMNHCGYLGHFAQDKFVQMGHNFGAGRRREDKVAGFFQRMSDVGAASENETADEKFKRQQRIADEEAKDEAAKKKKQY